MIGRRQNDLEASLPYLREQMPPAAFQALSITEAPGSFIEVMEQEAEPHF